MAMNPTGTNTGPQAPILYDPNHGSGGPAGATGGPGNYNFGNSQNPTPPPVGTNQNPFQVPLPTMPVSMNPGGAPTTGLPTGPVKGQNGQILNTSNQFGQTPDQQNRTLQEFQNQYGEGMGSLIYQYLQSGGGYNSALADQTVQATNKAMEQNIQLGLGNLTGTLGAQGISPDSSVSALETSNYESNAMTQMNAIDANIYNTMFEQGQNRELSVLEGGAKVDATAQANSQNWFQQLNSFLGFGQSAAGGASALTSAINPGADTSILDALAGFCWVASELYGGWFAPETMAIRGWLLRTWYMAPFVVLYRRFGKQWASLIHRSMAARKITKSLFDKFLGMANAHYTSI